MESLLQHTFFAPKCSGQKNGSQFLMKPKMIAGFGGNLDLKGESFPRRSFLKSKEDRPREGA